MPKAIARPETKLMIELSIEGLSASAIARVLETKGYSGISRNAVIGRLRRAGYRLGVGRQAAPSPRVVKLRCAKPEPVAPPAPPTEALDEHGNRFTTLSIRKQQCRFPIGEVGDSGFHYCGHETAPDESWCAHHRGVVWTIGAAKRKRDTAEKRPDWNLRRAA